MSVTRDIKLRGGMYGIVAVLALCAIAFLALGVYLGLLNVTRPALAALLTATGAAALAGVILAASHRSARRERQQAGNPIAGLEGLLARQADWAYAFSYRDADERAAHLPHWLHDYNWHRQHGSLGHRPPISVLGLSEDNLVRLHT